MNIPIEQIEVLDRARKDYGDLTGLIESIRINGQITPGTVRRATKLDDEVNLEKTPWVLVAGGRRFAACAALGLDTYKAEDFGTLSPLQQRVIELEENLHRKDLAWDEEVFLKEEIHLLRTAQAAEKGEVWTQTDTGKELGESVANVSRDLSLAKSLRENPELAAAPSKISAVRMLKFERSIKDRAAKANQASLGYSRKKLVTADMRQFIRTLPENCIDLTFTDFPFGIEYNFEETDANKYEDSAESLKDLLTDIIPQMFRVTKPTGWLALMMGSTNYEFLRTLVEACCVTHLDYNTQHINTVECKYLVAEDPEWIWYRPNSRNPSMYPELHAQNQYEKICVVNMGQAVMVQKNRGNVLMFDAVYEDRIHTMQRPHELCKEIVERMTLGGELVADFCFGSGSALAAAAELQRDFIGCDINPQNLDPALVWVAEHLERAI